MPSAPLGDMDPASFRRHGETAGIIGTVTRDADQRVEID